MLFALWCLALNNKGVAVFFHRDKALERLVLSFVQECLDGQASILIIQPFGTHSDNEVVYLSDNIGHQVMVAQSLANCFIIAFDGKADGCGKAVLEAIKAYAQELGLEYGPVNYFMMCDPKYANDLGEIVQ